MSKAEFIFNGELVEASSERIGSSFEFTIGEKKVGLEPAGENQYWVEIGGRRRMVAAVYDRGVILVDIDSVLLEITEPSEDGFAGGAGDQATEVDKVFAPMPGKIVKLLVSVGDVVKLKQPMVIVEAMKMENQVNSKADGKVKAINFAEGDQVDTESPIIELELEEG